MARPQLAGVVLRIELAAWVVVVGGWVEVVGKGWVGKARPRCPAGPSAAAMCPTGAAPCSGAAPCQRVPYIAPPGSLLLGSMNERVTSLNRVLVWIVAEHSDASASAVAAAAGGGEERGGERFRRGDAEPRRPRRPAARRAALASRPTRCTSRSCPSSPAVEFLAPWGLES